MKVPYLDKLSKVVKGTDEDIAQDLNERITSPFLVSFCVSWALINWRVAFGIFYYKPKSFADFVTFVDANITKWNAYWCPLIFAVLYSFVYPFFRGLITVTRAWISKLTSRWLNKTVEKHMVPLELLIDKRRALNIAQNELAEIIKKESVTGTELSEKKIEIQKLNAELIALKGDLSNKQKMLNDAKDELVKSQHEHFSEVLALKKASSTAPFSFLTVKAASFTIQLTFIKNGGVIVNNKATNSSQILVGNSGLPIVLNIENQNGMHLFYFDQQIDGFYTGYYFAPIGIVKITGIVSDTGFNDDPIGNLDIASTDANGNAIR